MGDVNRDYHRRVRPTLTAATAASLVVSRGGRALVSSGEPFTPPMATRTPRGRATTRRGDAVSETQGGVPTLRSPPSPLLPFRDCRFEPPLRRSPRRARPADQATPPRTQIQGAAGAAICVATRPRRPARAEPQTSVPFRPDTRKEDENARPTTGVPPGRLRRGEVAARGGGESEADRARVVPRGVRGGRGAARSAAAAAVAEGMAGGVRSAGASPVAAAHRLRRAGKALSPVRRRRREGGGGVPDSSAASMSGASANASA